MAGPPAVIEVLDAPSHPTTAAGVLARLAEREEERAANTAARLEQLAVAADPRESVDAFMADFAARRQKLEAALQAAEDAGGAGAAAVAGSGAAAAAAAGGGDDAAALATLAEQVAELEKAVAEATYFLPVYDLRHATLALGTLRERQEAAAAALQPRRRFAFNRKASCSSAQGAGAAAPTAAVPAPAAQRLGASSDAPAGNGVQQANGEQRQDATSTAAATSAPASGSSGSTISGLRGAVVAPSRAEVAGQEFTLTDLQDCTVFLLAPLAALFLHRLRRCRVYAGPVAGACFVEGSEDCTFMIAARQVRIHAAERSDFYLRVKSHPIIEHSSALRFAPYELAYPGAAEDLLEQGLGEESGMWERVNDFGWLRATPSPNWALLPEVERAAAPAAAAGRAAGEA